MAPEQKNVIGQPKPLDWAARVILGATKLILLLQLLLVIVPSNAATAIGTDLKAPQLFFRTESGALQPAMSARAHLDIHIRSGFARVMLRQTFINNSSRWTHAVYALPLPDRAAVHGWVVDFGRQRLKGVIQEREQAEYEFKQAQQDGRQAAMLETLDAGLYQVRVANIEPNADVAIEVEMTLPVDVTGRHFSFRFPTTLTPRYRQSIDHHPNDNSPDLMRDFWKGGWQDYLQPRKGFEQPTFVRRSIIYPFTWRVLLEPAADLLSLSTPLHASQFARTSTGYQVLSSDEPADMDRDFLLRWQLIDSSEPKVAISVEEWEGEWFASLDMLEPSSLETIPPVPQELIFVVDVSGSMSGVSIEQAKAAVARAIELLQPQDVFNVIAFDHRVFQLFESPQYATPDAVLGGLEFVGKLEADGGTEMAPALMLALEQISDATVDAPQIVFITDGAVSDEQGLYQLIAGQLGSARLSTVAIGPAPNSAFMRQAAALGRGVYRQVTQIGEVASELNQLIYAISRPLLKNIQIDWPFSIEAATDSLPDLYVGEPLRQLVRSLEGPPRGVVTVRAELAGWPWQADVPINAGSNRGDINVIAKAWAQTRIQQLLDDATLKGLPQSSVRDKILPMALAHQLVTPFTSMLAQAMVRARPPSAAAGQYALPNQLPVMDFDYPQTATSFALMIYLGLFGGFLALLVMAMAREIDRHD